VTTFLLTLAHLGLGTLWLGGMAYSLFVVQPRAARVLPGPERVEDLYRELAAGNRWRVVGLIAALAVTGLGLAVLADARGAAWWLAVGLKAALLAGAAALFWWVSWRGWPRRVFALPDELPAEQARFRRVALAMTALVATAFVVGVAVAHWPGSVRA
jgi:hypothetical protein